jgi:hypothetical protein
VCIIALEQSPHTQRIMMMFLIVSSDRDALGRAKVAVIVLIGEHQAEHHHRDEETWDHQVTPYWAPIRRAFCSSVSRRLARACFGLEACLRAPC